MSGQGERGRTRAVRRAVDGLLLLDKPTGRSSNWALQRARALLEAAKAGHAGTLDPLATGLLPLLFGQATRFAAHLSDAGKAYEATLKLGMRTDSGDATGQVVETRPVGNWTPHVDAVLASFVGEIEQTPPMFSAVKVDGRALYRLAREGVTIERASRRVTIFSLEALAMRPDELDVRIECSKGTYVRVLGEAIGEALGCCATVKALRRIRSGGFGVGGAVTLEALEAISPQDRVACLLPTDAVVAYLPEVRLAPRDVLSLEQGRPVVPVSAARDGLVRAYSAESGHFVGLAEYRDGTLVAARLLGRSGGAV